jgi:sugar lactone lactonase YvrE
MQYPSGIVIDSQFTAYIADAGNHRIQRFSPDDTTTPSSWSFSGWLGAKAPNVSTPGWLTGGSGLASVNNGAFRNPYGIGLANDSHLLVADTNNNRVQVLDAASGLFVTSIGAAGTTSGQYNQPLFVCYADSTALIADSSNARIQKSTLAGEFMEQIVPDTSILNTRRKGSQ